MVQKILLLAALAPLTTGRILHPSHKGSSDESDEGSIPPPWEFGQQEEEDSGVLVGDSVLVEAAEVGSGLQSCPSNPNLTGYSSWNALIVDVESNNSNRPKDPYLLCPQFLYDGLGTTLTISHYYTTIQCADLSRKCVVTQASIMIAENLKGIRFEGIEFTNPTTALVVGKGTHTFFVDSSISGALFNNIEESQAPIVSFGHLFVIGSTFVDNTGFGAIWAIDDTLYVEQSRFQNNRAVSFRNSGAAIHIGSNDPDTHVASTITGSCFQGNFGYHVVFVQGEFASAWAEGNAVDNEAECPGITYAINATAGFCEPFDVQATSSCDAKMAAAPATESEEETEPEATDPLAEAAGEVTFESRGLQSSTAGVMILLLAFVAMLL